MEKEAWSHKLKKVFNKKKFIGFLDRFGFYLILLICLMIIGVTAILTRGGIGNQPIVGEEKDSPGTQTEGELADNTPSSDIDIKITDIINEDAESSEIYPGEHSNEEKDQEITTEDNENTPSKAEEGEVTKLEGDEENTEAAEEEEDIPASAQAGSSMEMAVPVSGQVIRSYCVDELIYSPTLKEWTTHTGIDIAGPLGGEVRAALDGVVESIEEDPLKGIVITLAHDDNLKTVYMGLSTKDMVREGQQIQKGQVISGIGRTAAFEVLDDSHLHFEVLLNGEHQNPEDYIKIEQEK